MMDVSETAWEVVGSSAGLLVLGAIISGLVGLWFDGVRGRFRRRRRLDALGALLHGELSTKALGPPDFESYDRFAKLRRHSRPMSRVTIATSSLLLEPGVLDPYRDEDFILELLYLSDSVNGYNDCVEHYNAAQISGDIDRITERRNDLIMAGMDCEEASSNLLQMLPRMTAGLSLLPMPTPAAWERLTWRYRLRRTVQRYLNPRIRDRERRRSLQAESQSPASISGDDE